MTSYKAVMVLRIVQPERVRYQILSGDSVPAPRINMRKIKDVLRLKLDAKLSHQQIAAALGISKGVVTKYVGLAATADWTGRQCKARMKSHWNVVFWSRQKDHATMFSQTMAGSIMRCVAKA
jgi:hypothetical protein